MDKEGLIDSVSKTACLSSSSKIKTNYASSSSSFWCSKPFLLSIFRHQYPHHHHHYCPHNHPYRNHLQHCFHHHYNCNHLRIQSNRWFSLATSSPKAKQPEKSSPPKTDMTVFIIIHGIAMLVMIMMIMMIKMTPTMSMKVIEYCLCWWCCTHDGFLWLDGKKRTPSSHRCYHHIHKVRPTDDSIKIREKLQQRFLLTSIHCRGIALAVWMSQSKLVEKSCRLFLLSLLIWEL